MEVGYDALQELRKELINKLAGIGHVGIDYANVLAQGKDAEISFLKNRASVPTTEHSAGRTAPVADKSNQSEVKPAKAKEKAREQPPF
jgi:hypothetical protein